MRVKLFFSGLVAVDSTSDDPRVTEFKPRYAVKTVKHGAAKIMVWGCFSCSSVGPIYLIPGIMDRFEYLKILEENCE